jgi:uncharacterized membrane protein (DUF485 family)
MVDEVAARVEANPKYHRLVGMRSTYSIIMTLCVMVVYYDYILLIAFNKEWLGTKLAAGWTTSVGIPLGVGVIVITIILTNLYVRRANTEFDSLNAEIIKEANKK